MATINLSQSVLTNKEGVSTAMLLREVLKSIPAEGILTEEVGARLMLLERLNRVTGAADTFDLSHEELKFLLRAYQTARWSSLDQGIAEVYMRLVALYNTQE